MKENEEKKHAELHVRITEKRKNRWVKICEEKGITLTGLVVNSVENRILDDERKKVLAFIDKQDNIFAKIENNINQFARWANSQKSIGEWELRSFNSLLSEVANLKREQNEIFKKIYQTLAK